MAGEPGKKGFLAGIRDALYETVEVDEGAGSARTRLGRDAASGPGSETAGEEPAASTPLEITPEQAARIREQVVTRGQALAQFLALAASFTEIIPEESGRYRAAMKALEKTGNLSRVDVLQAAKEQLLALQAERERFAERASARRREVKGLGGGVEALRAQVAQLQQTITELQQQEQAMVGSVAAEEGRIKAAEEAFAALASSLEAEILAARKKLEQYLPG